MKCSPGDIVRMKATGEEGVVVSILDEDMVEVEVDGTRFPSFVEDLEHPYLHWFQQKGREKKASQRERKMPTAESAPIPSPQKEKEPRGIHLALLPEFSSQEDQVDSLRIYLVHHLDIPCLFEYSMEVSGKVAFHLRGNMAPGTHLYLHRFALDQLNEQPRFFWDLLAEGKGKWKAEGGKIKIKPRALFAHIEAMKQGEDPLLLLPLIHAWTPWTPLKPDPPIQKTIRKTASPSPKGGPSRGASWDGLPRYELDLHIEALIPHHRGMSATEMLRLQMEALEREVHMAIARGADRMVIIHGLGKGVLRVKVHRFLGSLEEVKSFHNDWHPRYGFGATEVHFRRGFERR